MVASTAADVPSRVVFYDGVCALCNRAVQQLLRLDRTGCLWFAPLQGSTAAALRRRHPEIPARLDSIVFLELDEGTERVCWHAEALFRIAATIGLDSWQLRWARRLPRWCADLAYRLFARVRYRAYGRLAVCPLPPSDKRDRFLP